MTVLTESMLWLSALGASIPVALILILVVEDEVDEVELLSCWSRITGTVDWGDSESRRWRLKAGEEAAELGSVGGGGKGGDRLPPPNVLSRILFVVLQ